MLEAGGIASGVNGTGACHGVARQRHVAGIANALAAEEKHVNIGRTTRVGKRTWPHTQAPLPQSVGQTLGNGHAQSTPWKPGAHSQMPHLHSPCSNVISNRTGALLESNRR